ARIPRGLHVPCEVAHACDRCRLPASWDTREDHLDPRRAVWRPGLAGCRGGVERGGVQRSWHTVPACRRAVRTARGDIADLPPDVERRRLALSWPALRA